MCSETTAFEVHESVSFKFKFKFQIQKKFIATNTLIYTTYIYRYTATMRVTKQMLICPSMGSEINLLSSPSAMTIDSRFSG